MYKVLTPTTGVPLFCPSESMLVTHSSISPSREADLSCPVARHRTSPWGTVASFVPPQCLAFPQTCPGSLACLLCGPAGWSACQAGATGVHSDSRPAIQPAIHAIERLTSCTPMAQNKASLWGTVVGFVPPPVMPCIPQTCPGSPLKAQGTGRSWGLTTPPFPLFLRPMLSLY